MDEIRGLLDRHSTTAARTAGLVTEQLRALPPLLRRHYNTVAGVICAVLGALLLHHAWALQHHHPRRLHAPASSSTRMPDVPAGTASAGPVKTRTADQGSAQASAPAQDPSIGRDNPFEPPPAARESGSTLTDKAAPADAAAAQVQPAVRTGGPGVGRANPFEPVVDAPTAVPQASPAPAAAPRRGAGAAPVQLPPIPPLDPSGPMPGYAPTGAPPLVPPAPLSAAPAPATPPPGLRLAGFITGPVVLAVIEAGGHSHVVAPGDIVEPGLRVIAVDAARQMVHLDWRGAPLDLTVSIPTP